MEYGLEYFWWYQPIYVLFVFNDDNCSVLEGLLRSGLRITSINDNTKVYESYINSNSW